MKQLLCRYWLAAGLVVLSTCAGSAEAGSCGPAGCGVGGVAGVGVGVGYGTSSYEGVGFNNAWIYPDGGYTVYPGQPGSCFPSHSDYSKVYWTAPPTENAQKVLDRLRELGIPQVPPDTIYLGKNPRAAENARLPIPRGWAPKEVEPKEADPKGKEVEKPKDKEPEKLKEKPKPEGKDKKADDDL